MARRRIPQVINDQLIPLDAGSSALSPISVGSGAWYAWLTDATTRSFAFRSNQGNFTARREQQRGSWYWYAYRTQRGQLHKVYIGKSEEVTLERLMHAAVTLARFGSPPATNTHTSAATVPPPAPQRELGPEPAPLLTTKFYVPRPRPGLVSRPRLTARLDAGLGGTLTLISAPAGFGKTTLLSDWLHRKDVGGRMRGETSGFHPSIVAWLSLDAADNDITYFMRYLVASLQTIAPAIGATTLALLQSPQPLPLPSLLTVLINDLTALPQSCILVLDDYHVLRAPPIHQAVSFLLDHLPPQLHLVIATREDPPLLLAKMRARRQVNELRAADLRFTANEAAAFLNEVMQLNLSIDDVEALEERTEGWIAGLQLAALSMQDSDDIASFIAAFTGNNRFVVDYLVDEVFSRQPETVQTFLLCTSILDRLCGPLCDAVIGEQGSQALLQQVEQANLFLVPLDAERRWYRYHHLFADLLQHRLRLAQPNLELELHRRASEWYEHAGLASEAIQHGLMAQDFQRAAESPRATCRGTLDAGGAIEPPALVRHAPARGHAISATSVARASLATGP